MQASQTPTLVPLAFAANGTKNTIPEASQIGITNGAASLNDGFPPLTFTPVAAGGVPPAGADFNGVLNLITQTIRWKHAGGQFGYSSSFANDTNVGGYPKGAVLIKAGLNGLWMSTTDNNTANPDTGGAGWVDPLAGRFLGVQTFTSSGTYTPGTYNGVTATKARFRLVGGGGGGGGVGATNSAQAAVANGGNGGEYVEAIVTSGLAAMSITIGAAGAGGAAGFNNGSAGGSSSVGALFTANGGNGGAAGGGGAPPYVNTGQANNSGTALAPPVILRRAELGGFGLSIGVTGQAIGGQGGGSPFGSPTKGGASPVVGTYGCGGGGASIGASSAAAAGANGSGGYLIVEEYA